MAGLFFGDERAVKAVAVPIDFEEWVNNLRRRAEGYGAQDSAWFRAVVNLRAAGAASIPRRVMRGTAEIDESMLPFTVDLGDLFHRGSLALDMHGAFYAAIVQNGRGAPLEVRFLDPRTIRLRFNEQSGALVAFERVANGRVVQTYRYDPATRTAPGLAWAWTPGLNEIGPGDVLADTCALPAKTLVMADELMRGLFERGAINQHFVTADYQAPEAEKERLRDKLRRAFFGGVREAHNIEVFSSGLTITPIGTAPNALELGPTAMRLQDDICALAQTPRILLTPADASNRSVIDRTTQTWLQATIAPRATLIAHALNVHALAAVGYRIDLNLAAMDVDQEEEAAKAAAWAIYVDRGVDPETAAAMLGIDIPEGMPFIAAATATVPAPPVDDDEALPDEFKRLSEYTRGRLHQPFKSDVFTREEIESIMSGAAWAEYP